MSKGNLSLEKREVTGKKVARLRADGFVPSVVYGGQNEPILTQSSYNETDKAVRVVGYHSPITLEIAGKKQLAMVKDVSFDPVGRTIANIEFQAITADEIITATTPIELVGIGNSPAEQRNLSISHILDEIEVKAKPADLPESLKVSVEGLVTIEDQIVLGDIQLPANVKFADAEIDLTQVVANVYDAVAEAEQQEAEDAKAAEAAAVTGDVVADVPADNGGEAEAEEAKE